MNPTREDYLSADAYLDYVRRAIGRIEPEPWEVDYGSVSYAAAYYGLEWPVEVHAVVPHKDTYLSMDPGSLAYYDVFHNEPRHRLVVSRVQPTVLASCSIWHELTHAKQAERSGKPPKEWWRKVPKPGIAFMDPISYLNSELEREPTFSGVLHWDVCPLTYLGTTQP